MYFGTKSYLKSNHNHTAKHALIVPGDLPDILKKYVDSSKMVTLLDFSKNGHIVVEKYEDFSKVVTL